jgi:hypothetical protein
MLDRCTLNFGIEAHELSPDLPIYGKTKRELLKTDSKNWSTDSISQSNSNVGSGWIKSVDLANEMPFPLSSWLNCSLVLLFEYAIIPITCE